MNYHALWYYGSCYTYYVLNMEGRGYIDPFYYQMEDYHSNGYDCSVTIIDQDGKHRHDFCIQVQKYKEEPLINMLRKIHRPKDLQPALLVKRTYNQGFHFTYA